MLIQFREDTLIVEIIFYLNARSVLFFYFKYLYLISEPAISERTSYS